MATMTIRKIPSFRAALASIALGAVLSPPAFAAESNDLKTATVEYREVEQTYAAEGVV